MKILRRCTIPVAAALAVCIFVADRARADPLYSVTDLGLATPTVNAAGQNGLVSSSSAYPYLSGQNLVNSNGNYLTALSQSQQVAFQAGSFDVYAHPATSPLYGQAFYSTNRGYDEVGTATSNEVVYQFSMTTSNNLGVTAGTASDWVGALVGFRLVTFVPDPHMGPAPFGGSGATTISSPGYLTVALPGTTYGQFFGSVSGINDHNVIADTQYQYPGSQTVLVPYLGDHSLGSLGGTNGAAYALNNSNEVVGWSQIASGAPHAFLYSGGSMQDLNSLIPSSSGIVLTSAVGIDAAGEIVAYGTNASGQTHEYFLTPLESPVPEPSTLAVMASMIVALAVRQARVRRSSKE